MSMQGMARAFDGAIYSEQRDGERLARQQRAVRAAMSDGRWHTLSELGAKLGYPEASVSARLRDLRKPKHGGHTVERRYAGSGLWEYRLVPKEVQPW